MRESRKETAVCDGFQITSQFFLIRKHVFKEVAFKLISNSGSVKLATRIGSFKEQSKP